MERGKLLAWLALGLVLLVPSAARGQGSDPQRALAAQALFEQADAEMEAGQIASACKRLEEVTRLVPDALGGKLKLGECYEKLGRLASAWSQFAIVAQIGARVGQAERAEEAARKQAALKPRLALITVEVPAEVRATPGLTLTQDGFGLGEALWGTALPADAGPHEFVATAPGYRPWKKKVEVVADGAKVTVPVPVNALSPELASATQAGQAPGAVPPIAQWQRPAGLVALASGGVSVGVGAILGGLAIARKNASNRDNHCDPEIGCDKIGLALRSEAVGLGNGSTAAFAVGGALLAGGVVLLLTAPPVEKKKPSVRPAVALGLTSVWLKGAW